MPNLFNSVQMLKPKKNVFDLTHDVKLSFNMGELIPICVLECVPGDKFNISAESLLRFAPLVSPVMHRSDVTMHYFFAPNRILWPGWEKFITNTKDPVTGLLPALPHFVLGGTDLTGYTRLCDYIGLPRPQVGDSDRRVSALPLAAYQKIYDEYYRDQNLITSTWKPLADGTITGSDLEELTALKLRAWEHDYFTSALPFAQKGDPVAIPLGKVSLTDDWDNFADKPGFRDGLGTHAGGAIGQGGLPFHISAASDPTSPVAYDPEGSLEVDSTTINDLRRAFKLQEWLEKNARGGTRYVENILAHFGVRSSDKRLQRPEYITGTKSPVVISEVLNTTGTVDAPQGEMAGHGISVTAGKNGNYYCEEHGFIIGIMSVLPKPAYQQGIPRHFLKEDPTSYFWPSFANIGEQEVQNDEIYAYQTDGQETFGYVPRYAEYKYQPSRVAGDFRTSLDFWHMGRIFATQPRLNQAFVECVPDNRIFAVTDPDVQHMYCHVLNKIRAVRAMPKYGTPTF